MFRLTQEISQSVLVYLEHVSELKRNFERLMYIANFKHRDGCHAERLKLISEIRRGIELLGENFDLEAYDDSDPERESRENTTS